MYHGRNIRKGVTVIDIGAGIGEFSVLASKLVGKHGKVISIEPSPNDFETLMMNLKTKEPSQNNYGNLCPSGEIV